MCLRRRGSAGIRWPCCPRRRAFLIIRCSRSHASLISPKALSYFRQKPGTRVTFESSLPRPRYRLLDIRTSEPHLFLALPVNSVRSTPSLTVTFEEEAGLVSVAIRAKERKIVSCELAAPQPFSLGKTVPAELV